jgi:hypothetical protein
MKTSAVALLALVTGASFAQAGSAGPPADALLPDPPRLHAAVMGHAFQWRTEDSERAAAGVTARMQFREGGLVTTEVSTGVFDTGTWTVDGSKLCFRWKTLASGCNDVRIAGETLWLQHPNGKWSSMKVIREGKAPARPA